MLSNRRSVMTLYSNKLCPECHRIRIIMAEKGVQAEIVEVDKIAKPEVLYDLNPYATTPTLMDRDLVLYDINIIQEYLEERFPHPPLLPVYPVARGRARLMMCRVERDWYSLYRIIMNGSLAEAQKARKDLIESFTSVAEIFSPHQYFMSDEYSLVDCSVSALLWRLPMLGVELPPNVCRPILEYMKRVFNRDAFQKSLSDAEREIHESGDF